ncbi:MAG: hypothetical protein JXD22_03740 [Sedimentisphaerales bacterium]|nr:hypothetical protein [Sedimentisphaerales bacterium]
MKTLIYIFWFGVLVIFAVGCNQSAQMNRAGDLTGKGAAGSGSVAMNRDEKAGVAEDGSAELAFKLAFKEWGTNAEACSMMLYLVEGEDRGETFEQKQQLLQSKGILPGNLELSADEPVRKGTLALMLCRALDIKGGLFMHLVGGSRYAYREAVYLEFMQGGSEREYLTGPEVVDIMGRVARMKHEENF